MLQGLNKTKMERVVKHLLHALPTTTRSCFIPILSLQNQKYLVHPTTWWNNGQTIRKEDHSAWSQQARGPHEPHRECEGQSRALKSFQQGVQAHQCLHNGFYEGDGVGLFEVQDGERGKNHTLPKHTQWFFSNIIKEKKNDYFKGETHFGAVVMEPIKIVGWPNKNEHQVAYGGRILECSRTPQSEVWAIKKYGNLSRVLPKDSVRG